MEKNAQVRTEDILEAKLHELEEKLSSCSAQITELESLFKLSEDQEEPHHTHEDISLVDGLLQELIQGFNFQIRSNSDNHDSYSIIFENTPDSVVEMDAEGRILKANPAFCTTFGFLEQEVKGHNLTDLTPENYRKVLNDRVQAFSKGNFGKRIISADDIIALRAHHKQGKLISMECLLSSFFLDDDLRIIAILRDLSFNRELFDKLRESKENYDALSETITEVILRIDEDFHIIFANSAVKNTFGYEENELIGQNFNILFPPEIFDRHKEQFRKYFIVDDKDRAALGLDKTLEILGKHKHRGVSPMEMSFGNSKDYSGRTLTCIIRDISQRKNVERRLRHLAYHDPLTNLGNRDLFNSDMTALTQALGKDANHNAALLFCDLDGFKQVNDTQGHRTGDMLLMETAKRIRGCLRESDSLYRFGGDEFVVLLPRIFKKKDAAKVAQKILRVVHTPYHLIRSAGTTTINVGISIGISIIPDNGKNVETLTRAADIAMYSAKEAGRNRFRFYVPAMKQLAKEKWDIEQGIKKALYNNEFKLNYQPLVDNDGHIKGVEALIRWKHSEMGDVSPGRFIPIAEETGLIVPLGNWILETACREIARVNTLASSNLYVSVNLSPVQFEQKDLVSIIDNVIHRTGINPENLKLEITETSIMNAPEEAISKMEALKKKHPGIKILIDDFGTGYSSLSYLSKLPADSIKIDISFVSKLFSKNNQKIVNAIINLAHSLSLDIIAEGVESEDQWNFFKANRCSTVQGFHFSKAISTSALLSLLKGPLRFNTKQRDATPESLV